MVALGMLAQSLVQVPGMEGVPESVSAIITSNGVAGGLAGLALIGALEATIFQQDS